jgi:hypothetical protein
MGDFASLQVGLYKLFGRELLVAPNAGQCSHCTVHFEDRLGASFLVQAIDVLGDNDLYHSSVFEFSQGEVGWIGLGLGDLNCQRTHPGEESLWVVTKSA